MRIQPAAVLVVLALTGSLAGCYSGKEAAPGASTSPSATASSSPVSPTSPGTESPETSTTPSTAKVADTLCVRVDQTLIRRTLGVPVVQLRPTAVPAEIGLPTYDVCELGLSTNRSGPVLRIGVSVLPTLKAGLVAAQKSYDATRGRLERSKPASVGRGGFGTSRFVVFLLGDKLLKVSGPPAGLADYVRLARDVALQAPGLPETQPLITREECDRGTAAAGKVLGAPATVRRDSRTVAGDIVCGWITATAVVSSSARTVPDAVKAIGTVRKAPTSELVPLGDEGFFDTATRAVTLRVGADKLVDLVPLPRGRADRDDMIAFALAVSALYTR